MIRKGNVDNWVLMNDFFGRDVLMNDSIKEKAPFQIWC